MNGLTGGGWLVGFGFGFGGDGGIVGSYICLTRSVTRMDMCASLGREGGEYHWCVYAEWMNRRKKTIKHVENSFIIQLFTYNIGFGNGKNEEDWELGPTAAKEETVKSEKMMEKGIIIIYTTNTIANSQGYMFIHHLQPQLQFQVQLQHKPMIRTAYHYLLHL